MKIFLASLVLFASTSSFASAKMETPKALRWAETPRILSTASCDDTHICVGSAISENTVHFVTCRTSISTDCPDAKTCFERNFSNNNISVQEATTKNSVVPSYGREVERSSGGKGKDMTKFPPDASK